MRRLLSAAAATAAALTLASCSFGEPPAPETGAPPNLPTPSGAPEDPATFIDVVAEGLEVPWGLDFLPDGTAIVGERQSGRLLALPVAEDGTVGEPEELHTIDVAGGGEGGLLGLAVSPDYADDGTVFLYYTTGADNRIARLNLESDAAPEPILTGIPAAPNHNGGALEFGPDGHLYAATGDAGVGDNAQDPESLSGKILRITPEGEPAQGNPDPDSPVYSSGHRNVEGLAWNAEGVLYATEFGQDIADEVNRIEPGGNYGWPLYEGPDVDEADYIDPVVAWEPFEASCAGAVFLEDALVTACLRGQRLWVVQFDASGAPAEPLAVVVGEFGRLRSVAMGPDGMLWVTTSNLDGRCSEERGCTANDADDRILRFSTSYAAQGRV
ncbi:PQQ-dependent sugar dehydrogenase [Glycomyces sp. TRM65418]|uniref:PQQ-dependent sugar dehydrogenase n=1 Tax=Glycomyces sp. TRM65418 TaxID=2867006 RepID=UPI001CE6DECD|nr:PQQ-dependent sugar dehydrogenase [Glycomyces sp. TRM65418]MCC3765418.1 PQQ-dependent sugar dehydrogenase [Glycomyces sp. TRM65418]QZD55029.1 PQQ-dependent sugar dehydrogenase [Glycomyces sp. TRM65418]